MFLKELSLINFRNLEEVSLTFTSRINCFVGGNGAGKTNAVDAIHYLSMSKSSLAVSDNQSVMHGSDFFMLRADYAADGGDSENIVCAFKKGAGKNVKRNGRDYERISEHIGLIPLVIVSPPDSLLVTDSAEERRRFLNSFLSQLDRIYLNTAIRYNQLLGERNKLLKAPHDRTADDIMDILDMQLAETGEAVREKRAELVARLTPLVAEYYGKICDRAESVRLEYRPQFEKGGLAGMLGASRDRDRLNQFTTCGIHRDELKMEIGGYPLRRYGSQGQQKSFLIALKLAQYAVVSEERKEKPLLLLDDIFDKLDSRRVGRLLSLVSGDGFGQIFVTDCNKVRFEEVKGGEDYSVFEVEDGKICRL